MVPPSYRPCEIAGTLSPHQCPGCSGHGAVAGPHRRVRPLGVFAGGKLVGSACVCCLRSLVWRRRRLALARVGHGTAFKTLDSTKPCTTWRRSCCAAKPPVAVVPLCATTPTPSSSAATPRSSFPGHQTAGRLPLTVARLRSGAADGHDLQHAAGPWMPTPGLHSRDEAARWSGRPGLRRPPRPDCRVGGAGRRSSRALSGCPAIYGAGSSCSSAHPARRVAGRRARSPAEHPHGVHEPGLPVPVLAT